MQHAVLDSLPQRDHDPVPAGEFSRAVLATFSAVVRATRAAKSRAEKLTKEHNQATDLVLASIRQLPLQNVALLFCVAHLHAASISGLVLKVLLLPVSPISSFAASGLCSPLRLNSSRSSGVSSVPHAASMMQPWWPRSRYFTVVLSASNLCFLESKISSRRS